MKNINGFKIKHSLSEENFDDYILNKIISEVIIENKYNERCEKNEENDGCIA